METQKCGLFLLFSLSFAIKTVIEVASHVAMIAAISFFFNSNRVTFHAKMNNTRVSLFGISGFIFSEI